ncbi:unnamed protein product [Nippostrongylus brasiliensis]|uniref:Zinc finger CCCH domain-containing protein 13 n=1 Tax=Nippostrongylus brasiliensis TaxID=27835 RepID=A0A0N4YEG4_NIPBR|nr:unnamed protein product [Nippostrongylus brasiliensis]
MRGDNDGVDDDDDCVELSYSVRLLRQVYLDRVRASSVGHPPSPRRITPLAASVTPSLPFIPEDDDNEERRLTRSQRTTSETALNRTENDRFRAGPPRFDPPPVPPPPPSTSAPERHHNNRSQTALNRTENDRFRAGPPRFDPPPVPPPPPSTSAPERHHSNRSQAPPSIIAVNVKSEPTEQLSSGTLKPRDPTRTPGEDYPERLMSPPPTKEPRSIIKQGYYSSHQSSYSNSMQPDRYSDRPSDRPDSSTPQTSAGGYNNRSRNLHFNDLPEEERVRIMKENLERHRQSRATIPKPPSTSFNGPFFKLEEVGDTPRSSEGMLCNGGSHKEYVRERNGSGTSFADTRTISASEAELTNIKDSTVVIWPPLVDKKPRSQSVMSRKITDPDRIDEYRRQKQMEEEAMRRHEEEKLIAMTKQLRAMQVQQQRLYEQRHGVISPVPFIDVDHRPFGHFDIPHSPAPDYQSPDYGPDPHRTRVYETRPISALSEVSDGRDAMPHTTWKRTYVVEKPKEIAKNEILNSDKLLEKDQYEVDILKRRAAFVEKPEEPPEIVRTGRRWQPPPEKPYVWPSVPRPTSVDLQEPRVDYPSGAAPRSADNVEYQWAPLVTDPGYRHERKNFTPTNSPPLSPRRGHGTGPLDEAARRQTKYLIQPSPDGSHRPKPAFRKERKPPSGGFYPHAPNAVKIVKHRPASAQGLLTPVNDGREERIEVIQQRNYHKLDRGYRDAPQGHDYGGRRSSTGRSESGVNDWEKIYELPPHSSTIVGKDVPTNIDVKRRLNRFEGSVQNLQRRQENAQRSYSVDSSLPYGSVHDMSSPPASIHHTERSHTPKRRETPRQHSRNSEHRSQHHPSSSFSPSRPPSTTIISPNSRTGTPTAIRVRTKMGQMTAPGPSPAAYDRARAHLPRPLPPGYRLADPPPDLRAVSPAPGHTKRMIRNMTETTNQHQHHQHRLDPHHFQPIRDRRLSPGSQYL